MSKHEHVSSALATEAQRHSRLPRTGPRIACAFTLAALCACAERAPGSEASPISDGGASSGALDDGGAAQATIADATLAPDGLLDATSMQLGADAGSADAQATLPTDAGTPDAMRTNLVLPESWRRLGPADDPFDDQPADASCSASAALAETLGGESAFGVETGGCNYISALQGTLQAVGPGELLKVRLWHFDLSADERAEAHVALLVDGLRLLDERVPIPHGSELVVRQLRTERAIPQGAPVYFHLHNHGANAWALLEVSAGP